MHHISTTGLIHCYQAFFNTKIAKIFLKMRVFDVFNTFLYNGGSGNAGVFRALAADETAIYTITLKGAKNYTIYVKYKHFCV